MESKLPAKVDRATFDRVLQRAAELQAASRDIGEGLSEDEVVALGNEVGINPAHLKQALLEERTKVGPTEPETFFDKLFGRSDVSADRVVQGSEENVSAALAKFLEYHEHLVVQRATIGRVTFEPMSPFAGAMRRLGAVFDPARPKPFFAKAELVTAVITPLESGFSHVTLAALMKKSRLAHIIGGIGLALTGAVVGLVLVLAGAAFIFGWIALGLMSLIGLGVTSQFHGLAKRTQLGIERTLDEMERRPALPGEKARTSPLAQGVGKVVREIHQEVRKALDK